MWLEESGRGGYWEIKVKKSGDLGWVALSVIYLSFH